MLEYLNQTLGLGAVEIAWTDEHKLPLFLRSGRTYSVLLLYDIQFLLVCVEDASFNLMAFQKQKQILEEYAPGEIILCFNHLTSYKRKTLIENRIPFIVPNSQIYVPSQGFALKDKLQPSTKPVAKLTAMAQYLILFLLYQSSLQHDSKVNLARHLGLTAMNITRAGRKLEAIGLIMFEKAGRCDLVYTTASGEQLFKKVKPYLFDPVLKRVFVKRIPELETLPLAGESAIAAGSMLNPPLIQCKAIGHKHYKEFYDLKTVDPLWYDDKDYFELQIWKYDPLRLSSTGCVDIVSLWASMQNNQDERIEQALDEIMKKHQW